MAMNHGADSALDFGYVGNTVVPFVDKVAKVGLLCRDYGGFTTITATRGSDSATIRLPKDQNGNWLADRGWVAETTQIDDVGLSVNGDIDNIPLLPNSPPQGPAQGLTGDGLTNFEEYRGFVVRGAHRRTNPRQMDLFISSNLATGIFFAYPNLPTATHRIRGQDEGLPSPDDWEYDSNRVINSRYTNSAAGGAVPGHYDQKGLRIYDAGTQYGYYGLTLPLDGLSKTPNETTEIQVYVGTHNSLADQPYLFTPAQIENEVRRTTGHEVGHAIHICHRGQTCDDGGDTGTLVSIMSAPFYGTPSDAPESQYNSFDTAQIRLQVRF